MYDWFCLPRRHVIAGSLAVGATMVGQSRTGLSQDKKTIKIRSVYDIKSIEPAVNYIADPEWFIMSSTLLNLIIYKPGDKWDWQLDAASDIKQVDSTHISFTLRPEIQWTNGYGELTADDVKYSYERMSNPELLATDRAMFEQFVKVQVTDKLSGIIVTKGPVANMWTTVLPARWGAIVSRRAWEERGGTTKGLGTEIPCFSGPYVVKEWVPQQKVVLGRNDLWNGPPVYYDEVEYILIQDDKTAETAFLAGEVDITRASIGSAKEFLSNPPPDTQVIVRATEAYTFVGINVEHEPYGDVRVRRAIRKAIDIQQIIDAAYFGVPPPSTGLIAPGVMGWRDAPIETRDVEGARNLLADAGYPNGFKTTLSLDNNTEGVTAAQVIQANLADIGVTVEILPYESGVFWDLGIESKGDAWKDLELTYQDWTSAPDPRSATQWQVSSQVGEWNWQRWRNAEYDQLDIDASVEMDPLKRENIYQKMMQIMYDDAAYINILHQPLVLLVRSGIDAQPLPNGYVYPRYIRRQ